MTLEEIVALELQERIEVLKKGRLKVLPNTKDILKSIDVKQHEIFDETIRLDKLIKADDGSMKKEPVARIGLGFQKLIVKRAVAFLFGNPVEYVERSENKEKELIVFNEVLEEAKINSFNRKIARDLFSCTEVAELWYPVPTKDVNGKETFKLRVKKLSPLVGDDLYPYFDEYGDLIAFSREYTVDEDKYFEVYTPTEINKYEVTGDPVLVDGYPKPNPLGKIPIVYCSQDYSAYYDVEDLIIRLEKLLSNFADTNDYHASPKIFVKGKILGFSKKGESGAIIEGDATTDVKYLSWDNAPESVKTEISTLKDLIYTLSQTPDISFESLKTIGGNAVSAKAVKFMFLDAHLKVMDNMEVFDEYLQRRTSVVKAFISQIRTELKTSINDLEIDAVVTPYMLDDTADKINFIMTANGNKPVISKRTAIQMAGLADDVEVELQAIKDDEAISVFEPTGLE